jgi:hypothetical protein
MRFIPWRVIENFPYRNLQKFTRVYSDTYVEVSVECFSRQVATESAADIFVTQNRLVHV